MFFFTKVKKIKNIKKKPKIFHKKECKKNKKHEVKKIRYKKKKKYEIKKNQNKKYKVKKNDQQDQ